MTTQDQRPRRDRRRDRGRGHVVARLDFDLPDRPGHAALLHHQLGSDPLPLTLAQHPDGGWGVALVLDGWYAGESDAQAVLDGYWREVVRAAVDATREPTP
ncbi:MAG: hypothetical protein R2737_07865 [Candidatus Nanopelagicales bacterium]